MGLRSGLLNLGQPRRRVADLAAPIQLASAAQQTTIKSAHQPPRSDRGQPVEAPQLGKALPKAAATSSPTRGAFAQGKLFRPLQAVASTPPRSAAWAVGSTI